MGLPWRAVRESVEVKLLAQDGELYILAQSRARIFKERGMRRRRLKKLWRRLHELRGLSNAHALSTIGPIASQSHVGGEAERQRRCSPTEPNRIEMCGFVCLWNLDDAPLARRMIEKLAHRGPDDLRVIRAPNVPAVMAHCRLSIIGPEDGAQPIHSAENVLVANGEIYNHADLRAILGESAFETASDSETILHLFRTDELRWIAKLDGMFAFVLATPERIIAARDPLGIKPLFMARIDQGLAFASELKAFDGLGLDEVEAIDPGGMFDSVDGFREWYRMPQGAAALEPGENPEPIWRELRLVLEAAVRIGVRIVR